DRAQGGLGVGLTLVRSLVELHGGRVDAFSDGPGRGSEFVVRLPGLSQAEKGTHTEKPATQQTAATVSRRILVVDDNFDAAETLALLLELRGHKVFMAHEGTSALETASEFLPDVILLDIGLPEMDGYEVARRLREHPQTMNSFLVAVTGYGQDHD